MLNTGASGYFSRPQLMLDPQLFEGNQIHPHVRQAILDKFYNYMDDRYHGARDWTMVWMAGSGVSYQWAADRGNGDLDVLFGIDFNKFLRSNEGYSHFTREELVEGIDNNLKAELWPSTSHVVFASGDRPYEVTYYLNPTTESYDESIKLIQPYAAFNLTLNKWTVDPIKLPNNPEASYPVEYKEAADANLRHAEELVTRYHVLTSQRASTHPSSPIQRNIDASLRVLLQEMTNMYDAIHLGRRTAFSQHGSGYGDYYNFQWQRAKRDGIVSSFNEILNREALND